MGSVTGRGGFRRPVRRPQGRKALLAVVTVGSLWLLAAVSIAQAHGGTATLQLGSERVNPGGTLEIRGDMTAEGPVDIVLVADAGGGTTRLGAAAADETGHFQTYLTVPVDLPVGAYTVKARSASDEARAPVAIVGQPVGDDGGQPPGQDEALAGLVPTASTSQPPSDPVVTTTAPETDLVPFVALAGAAVGLGVLFWGTRRRPAAPTDSSDLP